MFDISNLLFRDDEDQIHITSKEDISYPLNEYIVPAYANKHYLHFPKSKDQIIDIIDEDDEATDEHTSEHWPKKKFIE